MGWLKRLFVGDDTHRPAVTAAQAIAGVPLVANLLAAWGLFTPTASQQSSLTDLLTWGFVLIGADAALRIGRNVSDGMKAKAAAVVNFTSSGSPPGAKG